MKKRKIKLVASIASLALVVAVMGVGVWAATNASVTVKSKVSFAAAQDVEAYVYGTETGTASGSISKLYSYYTGSPSHAATALGNENTKSTLLYKGTGDNNTDAGVLYGYSNANSSFEFGSNAITETSSGATYTYTVTIVNNATSTATHKNLYIKFTTVAPATPTSGSPNYNVTTAVSGNTASCKLMTSDTAGNAIEATGWTAANQVYQLAQGKSITITVTFAVIDKALDISETGDHGFSFVMAMEQDNFPTA